MEPSSFAWLSTEIPEESIVLSTLPLNLPSASDEPSEFHMIGVRTYSSPLDLDPQ